MAFSCLIVDDNSHFLEAAGDLLRREGATVVGVASTIAEARQRAEELRPDVVLVDITLAEESGFELARCLDEDKGRRAVILISTHAEADFADLIAQSPAEAFLSKSELSVDSISRILAARSG